MFFLCIFTFKKSLKKKSKNRKGASKNFRCCLRKARNERSLRTIKGASKQVRVDYYLIFKLSGDSSKETFWKMEGAKKRAFYLTLEKSSLLLFGIKICIYRLAFFVL